MNKAINILLGVILIPTMFVAIYVGLDVPMGFLRVSGAQMPYREEIFLGLGLLLFIIILRRSIRRWMGLRIVNQVSKFKWNGKVSDARKSRVRMYLIMEVVVMLSMAAGLYALTDQAFAPALAFLLGAIDNILFALSANKYRVGLSSKALIIADREVIFLYFTGLRKVSAQQQSTFFDYIKGLQITFPTNCVRDEDKADFFIALQDQLDTDRVFFSKTMDHSEKATS